MTPSDALTFLYKEFIGRFGLDAEGCCSAEKTREAFATLAEALAVPNPHRKPRPG